MFRHSVSSTPFTSEIADSVFPNIHGSGFGSDMSMLATLRALVSPRIPAGEKVLLYFKSSNLSKDDMEGKNDKQIMEDAIQIRLGKSGIMCVHDIRNRDPEASAKCMAAIDAAFLPAHSGWEKVTKVTDFYRKAFNVLCFINREKKQTLVFVESMDLRKLHYLQCAILAMLPWYFDPEAGITEDEKALIYSMREREETSYVACLNKMAGKYDFEKFKIERLLNGFEKRYQEGAIENAKRDCRRLDEQMKSLNDQFREAIRKKNEVCIRILGLEQKAGDESSEIKDYFLCNRNLSLQSVNRNHVVFVAKGYISYFDEDMAKRVIGNKNSYVYTYSGNGISGADMAKLMTAIFIDQEVKIRTCAAYEIGLEGYMDARSHYDFESDCDSYMPNPHINNYSCMGNYSMEINDALSKNDFISAIESCMASSKSLNFGDSTVMGSFMRDMYNEAYKCFELPDGTIVGTKEAIEWVKANSGK